MAIRRVLLLSALGQLADAGSHMSPTAAPTSAPTSEVEDKPTTAPTPAPTPDAATAAIMADFQCAMACEGFVAAAAGFAGALTPEAMEMIGKMGMQRRLAAHGNATNKTDGDAHAGHTIMDMLKSDAEKMGYGGFCKIAMPCVEANCKDTKAMLGAKYFNACTAAVKMVDDYDYEAAQKTATTTAAQVATELQKSTFTTSFAVTDVDDFKEADYVASIKKLQSDAEVKVTVAYVVSVSYEFKEDVKGTEVQAAAAKMAGVAETAVTVVAATPAAGRRLGAHSAAGKAWKVFIKTETKADVAGITGKTNATSLVTELEAAGVTISEAPTQSAVALAVEVETEVLSKESLGDAAAVQSAISADTGLTAEVAGMTTTTETVAATSTTAKTGAEDADSASSAVRNFASLALMAAIAAVVV